MALIVKGVNRKFKVVVVRRSDCFSTRQVCANCRGSCVRAYPDDVEICRVVSDVDVGELGRRFPVRRRLLGQAADLAELGCRAMRLHVLKVLETRSLAQPRNLYVGGGVRKTRT